MFPVSFQILHLKGRVSVRIVTGRGQHVVLAFFTERMLRELAPNFVKRDWIEVSIWGRGGEQMLTSPPI